MHGTLPLKSTDYLAPTVAEPSLAGLVTWLETQDPGRSYDWWDAGDCLGCRYIGVGRYTEIHDALDRVGAISVLEEMPWTYSAALTRARTALAEQEG